MVRNCSKERPGSIVTKTLKSGILIPIATSKESHFNADFKYTSFIKFSSTQQKLRAWENLRCFRTPPKSHSLNENHTIRFSVSENPTVEVSSFYLQKCGILYFLPEGRSRMRLFVCLFFCFFPQADRIDPVVLECCERAHSNGNEKF